MKWEDVCQAFPNQWLLIEVVEAYTNDENERVLVGVTPLNRFSTSTAAMNAYQQMHKTKSPKRVIRASYKSKET